MCDNSIDRFFFLNIIEGHAKYYTNNSYLMYYQLKNVNGHEINKTRTCMYHECVSAHLFFTIYTSIEMGGMSTPVHKVKIHVPPLQENHPLLMVFSVFIKI